jgi:hypothetical protein
MGIHQEANAWGGGIGLDEHPLDANPIGIIDWAIIDNIIRMPGNSRVPHLELPMPQLYVTSGSSTFGAHWRLAAFDPEIADFLQREIVNERGELAVSVFQVNKNLTAFWYTADPVSVRMIDRNFSMMEAVRAGAKYSYLGWTWTHLLHVHPPDNYDWKGKGAFTWNKDFGRWPVQGKIPVPAGPGPGDLGACQRLQEQLGNLHPSQGVLDSLGQYWEYVP